MKTKVEIIEETVAYYSEDLSRRAVTSHGCEYLTNDDRMCAVGRCIMREHLSEYLEGDVYDVDTYFDDDLDSALQPEYRGHSLDFWTKLQQLHDRDFYWDANGLSPTGEEFAASLMENYPND